MNSYPQPTLPPLALPSRAHDDAAVVLWCRLGAAEVLLDGLPVQLGAGDAVLIGRGVEHRLVTAPGSVLVPVLLEPPSTPRTRALRGVDRTLGALLAAAHLDGFSRIEVPAHRRPALHARIRSAFEHGEVVTEVPPAAASRWVDDETERMLLWCARGRAAITVDPGDGGPLREVRLGRDQALDVPAGMSHRTRIAAGGAVVPVPLAAGGARSPRLLHLPTRLRSAAAFHGAVAGSDPLPELVAELAIAPAAGDVLLQPHAAGTPRWRVQRIRLALHDEPGDPSTLDDWAARFGVTRRSVERSFAEHDERPFAEWRHALRMRRAVDWLNEGRQAKWVSHRLGFAHLSAFSRAFSRHRGSTVREHQAEVRERVAALR